MKQWFTVSTLIMTLFHAGMPEPGAICSGALVELSRPIIIASLMCDSHAVVAFLKGLNIPFSLFVNVFYVTTYLRTLSHFNLENHYLFNVWSFGLGT